MYMGILSMSILVYYAQIARDFQNAIMEYMACGLPVITTAIGGNMELVDETNGITVSPVIPLNWAVPD